MTKDGGMEDYYESGGAITPDDAAPPFLGEHYPLLAVI
jgi:hypothetical protein